MSDGLLTINQIAKFLSVSPKTVYYWVGRAEIPFVRVGRHLRFDSQTVLQHFAGQTESEDLVIACARNRVDLQSRAGVWSLKTGAGLAGS